MFLLYRLGWALAGPLSLPLSLGSSKLARTVRGRRGATRAIRAWAAGHRNPARPLVWFHAASVGEGRQAEAVLVRLRAERPAWQVAYTFSSPSAEAFAGSLPVDFAGYLPLDTVRDAAAALDALRPSALVFSATDLWPELVAGAARRAVPVAVVSATLSPTSSRRGPLARALLKPIYATLARIGAIDERDAEGLVLLGADPRRITITGDTRHDAAHARAARVDRARAPLSLLAPVEGGVATLVAGSTWPADERVLLPACAELRRRGLRLRLLVAPHEPSPSHLGALERRITQLSPDAAVVRLSELESSPSTQHPTPSASSAWSGGWAICLIDRVGVLADLYAVASVAYVGGGFHAAGLHAVIEPAALGVPVLVGPRWQGSRDARLLLEKGGARSVRDRAELAAALLTWLQDETARATAGAAARAVVEAGRGAADRSVELVVGLMERRNS